MLFKDPSTPSARHQSIYAPCCRQGHECVIGIDHNSVVFPIYEHSTLEWLNENKQAETFILDDYWCSMKGPDEPKGYVFELEKLRR
jgi:hypothetical protein